ncbi:hypothetical protein [Microcoleus vaginatus]|uniref:hypothetical protein n=1 Tax=Microcoleus vaginatus TaxID=119532 RepID=UPI0032A77EFC
MPEYTFSILFEPLKANSTIQTIFDTNTLVAPIKTAIAGYIATLGSPAAETAHLSWENCGAAVYLEQLIATYHLPSLGIQTPAPALKRNSTLADKVTEISALNGQYPKCQLMLYVRNSAADPWVWKNTEVIQNYGNRANTLDLIPYLSQGTLDIFGKATQVGIQFISDPTFKTTLPAAGDRLSIKGALRVEVSQFDSKKNDVTEQLLDRMAMLELAVDGRLINLPPGTLLGRNAGTGVVEPIFQSNFAKPADIDTAISNLIAGAPETLNTLDELAAALADNASFAATITNLLALKAPLANPTFTGIINNSEGRIQFPSTQVPSTDPNCLDDYEEGTFTPLVIGVTAAGTATYTSQIGSYTKIGKRIFFDISVEWSNHTGTGEMRISGLPFLFASSPISACSIWHRNYTLTANNILMGYVGGFSGGIGQIVFSQVPVGGGSSTSVILDSAAGLMVNGSYLALA